MLLILSGSYVSGDMQSEFGRIPPAFLPLAGKALLEYQIDSSGEQDVFLALPSDYDLSPAESYLIESLELKIISVDHRESLKKCIVYCLDYVGQHNHPIKMLFGDTLIPSVNTNTNRNIIGISNGLVGFYWAAFNKSIETFNENQYLRENCLVLNGYFEFENWSIPKKAFSGSDDDFIKSVNLLLKDEHVSTLEMEHWLDFGHLHSFFLSRKSFTSERCFNNLTYQDGFFTKSAVDNTKILAEKVWFESLDKALQIYVPAVHSNDDNSYAIEYIYSLPVNELYLRCRLGAAAWTRIIKSCFDFLDKLHSHSSTEANGNWLLPTKTESRISSLPPEVRSHINEALRANGETFASVIRKANGLIPYRTFDHQFVHGDFCFSNILYDFRANRIKAIDPRGCDFNNNITVYGDPLYDYAKLAHSCIGRYDDIVAERYDQKRLASNFSLELIASRECNSIASAFTKELDKRNINQKIIYGYMVHLFLSMIPLHSDSLNRQVAFSLNAVRLIREADKL